MVIKLWCSKCPRPCYFEKHFSKAEDEEELLKKARCPFGEEEHHIVKAV